MVKNFEMDCNIILDAYTVINNSLADLMSKPFRFMSYNFHVNNFNCKQ